MNNRFDDWEDLVDCNKCQRYFDDTCDGAKVGYKKKCNSFVATRMSDIPARLDKLECDDLSMRGDLRIIWATLAIMMIVELIEVLL